MNNANYETESIRTQCRLIMHISQLRAQVVQVSIHKKGGKKKAWAKTKTQLTHTCAQLKPSVHASMQMHTPKCF